MPTELLRMIRAILVLPAVSVYLVSCCGCRDGNEDSYSKNENTAIPQDWCMSSKRTTSRHVVREA